MDTGCRKATWILVCLQERDWGKTYSDGSNFLILSRSPFTHPFRRRVRRIVNRTVDIGGEAVRQISRHSDCTLESYTIKYQLIEKAIHLRMVFLEIGRPWPWIWYHFDCVLEKG
jgi:hypothetical protein